MEKASTTHRLFSNNTQILSSNLWNYSHQNLLCSDAAAAYTLPASLQSFKSHTSLWSMYCSQEAEQKVSYKLPCFFFFLAIAAKCQKSFNLKPEETVIPASSQWNAKLRQVLRMCKCHRDSVLQRSHWHSSDSAAVFCFWFSTNYRQLDIRDLRMQKQAEILHDQLTSPIYKNTAFIYTSLQGQIDGMEREWGAGQGSFWFAWYCLLHAETSEIRLRFSLSGCCMETLLARSESPDVQPLLSESPCIKHRGSNHSNKKRSPQHFQSLFVLFISDNCLSSCMPSGDFAVILLSVF